MLTLDDRIKQLEDQASILSDHIQRVEQGDHKYFIPIATILRALVATGRARNFTPLLISLAKELNYSLKCYGPKEVDNSELNFLVLVRGLNITVDPHPVYSTRHVEYELEKWMDTTLFVWKRKGYTPNLFLRTVADSEGAHFDKRLPNDLVELREDIKISFQKFNINEAQRFLYQLAIATQELSIRCIEYYRTNR